MSVVAVERAKAGALVARARMTLGEMRKLGAFLRRDFITALTLQVGFLR